MASALDIDVVVLVDDDPDFLAHGADRQGDLAEGRFDRGGTVTTCDDGRSASGEAAALHADELAALRLAVAADDVDDQRALEPNVFFEGGVVVHRPVLPAVGA
jgi:hypothetical protein